MIRDKWGKSNGQIGLRYLTQLGVIVIPKSVNKDRIIQNNDIFDFQLKDEERVEIAKLGNNQHNTYPHYELAGVKQILASNLTSC